MCPEKEPNKLVKTEIEKEAETVHKPLTIYERVKKMREAFAKARMLYEKDRKND